MSETDRDRANKGVVGGIVLTASGAVLLLIGLGGSGSVLKIGSFCVIAGLGVVIRAVVLSRRSG